MITLEDNNIIQEVNIMTNEATINKMQRMKFYGMIKAFHQTMETGIKNKFTPDELLAHLIDCEWEERQNRKLTRLIKNAKFRYQASIEQLNFTLKRNLDKNLILRFNSTNWIENKQNIIITGATGSGKSFLGCAIGNSACINGLKVIYYNCSKLFSNLKLAKADGSYVKEINKIAKQDVLILDDFGLAHLDTQNRLSLLEILEDRYGVKSTIIMSQLPIAKWFEIINDKTIADAICDRLVHNSFKIELKGGSVRKFYGKTLTK